MKILYLPYNVASMPAITADAMNRLPGTQAVCLAIARSKYVSPGAREILIENPGTKNPLRYLFYQLTKFYHFIRLVLWADVVHFTWGNFLPWDLDLKMIRWLQKPAVVEWLGSDIRNPDVAFGINPYIAAAFENGYEYKALENDNRALATQKKFSRYGVVPVCCPEMMIYVEKSLFPNSRLLFQRINLSAFTPVYANRENNRPLIIHSPTAKVAKGSDLIIKVIEELKSQYDFDFQLLHDLPKEEVLRLMQRADIFLDQIIGGGYGMAAMEAMAFGKPVMCYIMPAVFNQGLPGDCPIVNTSPDNLKEQLIKMISDAGLRHQLGIKSRRYVEQYHDADKLSHDIAEIYKSIKKKSVAAQVAAASS